MQDRRAAIIGPALFLLLPVTAQAGGFALSDKSVSSLGYAFAGTAAFAEDASTLYNNPAGLVQLGHRQLALGVHVIRNEATFRDAGSNVPGDDTSELESTTPSPNAYFVETLGPDLRLGLGIFAPFGMRAEYDDDWRGRYHAVSTELKTVNLSPAVAWRVHERLALGASVDVQYLDAHMKQAVDFQRICQVQLGIPACSGLSDGTQKLEGDSLAYGYSVGLTWEMSELTRLGAVFHSDVRHTIRGDSDFSGVPAPFAGVFTDSSGRVTLHLPEVVSLSLAHRATSALTLLADATWTRWSRFDELRLRFDNGLPDAATAQEWEDVWRYALGLAWDVNPRWRLRLGISDEGGAVPDAAYRSPRSPDGPRRMYAVGFNYATSERFSLDVAYARVILPELAIHARDSLGHELVGDYEVAGELASVQGNWRF
ncbi:MAG: outer membrane protein transport protein [Thiohalomonadaceae bacterium]